MQKRLAVIALIGGGLIVPSLTAAQTTTSGAIAGSVKDTTGAVLPGVTVEASSQALIEKVRAVTTDDQGNYKITDLRPEIAPGGSSTRLNQAPVTAGSLLSVPALPSVILSAHSRLSRSMRDAGRRTRPRAWERRAGLGGGRHVIHTTSPAGGYSGCAVPHAGGRADVRLDCR